MKLGLTSEAKQKRMGVYAPFVEWLTDDMIRNEGDPVPQAKLIHPRIEPEIIFVMKDRLAGPGVSRESAMAAVGTVSASAEVIDSRYRNFHFRAGDVVADNASSGVWATRSVVVKPEDIDLVNEKVEVYVDGKLEHTRHRVAPQLEAGIVWVNSWFLRDLRTAFGGMKHSGIGREGGVHASSTPRYPTSA